MANKNVTIKSATDKELDELLVRMRKESELQDIITSIKRKSNNGFVPYDNPQISTEEPIDSLYHIGVLGMKWGKRTKRSVTPSEDHVKKMDAKKKSVKEMSNAEIKALNERMQLERTFKDLTAKEKSAGQKMAQDILTEVGKEMAKELVKKGVQEGVKLLVSTAKKKIKK